jgi:Fic-DOC domain mobile mystery protein B
VGQEVTGVLARRDDASTPLTPDERDGLVPSYITLRGELNEAEQQNILEADEWAFSRKRDVLHEAFLNRLHKRMYGNVWRWAGQYRTSEKNIGVPYYRIATELRALLDDCRYWKEHNTHSPDEIAAQFHHRLVQIHCYPNGNGRHARLAADLLLVSGGGARFSWGSANLADPGATRAAYVAALRSADEHDYGPLLAFVRS